MKLKISWILIAGLLIWGRNVAAPNTLQKLQYAQLKSLQNRKLTMSILHIVSHIKHLNIDCCVLFVSRMTTTTKRKEKKGKNQIKIHWMNQSAKSWRRKRKKKKKKNSKQTNVVENWNFVKLYCGQCASVWCVWNMLSAVTINVWNTTHSKFKQIF